MSTIKNFCVTETDIERLDAEYQPQNPQNILQFALQEYNTIAISFSGAEDVVLIDMASKLVEQFQVFCIDTGRLHPETYQYLDSVRSKYNFNLDIIFPDRADIEKLVSTKGFFSFYEEGHQECCGIRKVKPLRRKLNSLDAWITGQRKDQSPETRTHVPMIQLDTAFSSGGRKLIKFNPLANWTSTQVWQYIQANDVPYNPLHARGFISIGCEPCTRTILPNQHERQGRWWWEDAQEKECGFHKINLDPLLLKNKEQGVRH
jgi:phosphoadenosine phosphosulfate reductase